MRVMAAPRKYPDELRERATRMAVEARRDPATRPGALARIGKQLGINPETLRNWVTQAEIDGGVRPGTTTDDAQRIAELERESRELRSRLLHRCTSGQGVATRSSFSPRGTISTSIDPAQPGVAAAKGRSTASTTSTDRPSVRSTRHPADRGAERGAGVSRQGGRPRHPE